MVPGQMVCREGSMYDSVFVLMSGTCSIHIGGKPTERIDADSRYDTPFGSGNITHGQKDQFTVQIFGEMPFVLGEAFPYSVVAETKCVIREFSRKDLMEIAKVDPIAVMHFYEFIAYSLIDKLSRLWSNMCQRSREQILQVEKERLGPEPLLSASERHAKQQQQVAGLLTMTFASGLDTHLQKVLAKN